MIEDTSSYRAELNKTIFDYDEQIIDLLMHHHIALQEVEIFEHFKMSKLTFHTRNASKFTNDSRWIKFNYENNQRGGEILLGIKYRNTFLLVVEMANTSFKNGILRGNLNHHSLVLISIGAILDQCIHICDARKYALIPLTMDSYRIDDVSVHPYQLDSCDDDLSTQESILKLVRDPENRHEAKKSKNKST